MQLKPFLKLLFALKYFAVLVLVVEGAFIDFGVLGDCVDGTFLVHFDGLLCEGFESLHRGKRLGRSVRLWHDQVIQAVCKDCQTDAKNLRR